MLQQILNGKITGFVEASGVVEQEFRDWFAELPPLFTKREIGRDDLGTYMKAYAEQHQLLKRPQRLLMAEFKAENFFYHTSYVRWLMENGVKIYNVKRVFQFNEVECFRPYVTKMKEKRKEADMLKNPVKSNYYKAAVNCLYGATITNVTKHKTTKYERDESPGLKAARHSPLFYEIIDCGEGLIEVTLKKATANQRHPHTVGFVVLNHAKVALLDFFYSLLRRFINPSKLELIAIETDSFKFLLSTSTLDEAVEPEKLAEYQQAKRNILVNLEDPAEFARTNKEPGYWLQEWKPGLVLLASFEYVKWYWQ